MSNVKNQVATATGERFTAPRPTFTAPVNAEYTIPVEKDNTPAKPLAQLPNDDGQEKLANLIAKAQEKVKLAALTQLKRESKKVLRPHKRKVVETYKAVESQIEYGPEDVCDDREFIIRSRTSDYHSPEMKRLFWANGGQNYLLAGISYASAFTNMRNDKMKSISKIKGQNYEKESKSETTS